jgi:hypothetical protein
MDMQMKNINVVLSCHYWLAKDAVMRKQFVILSNQSVKMSLCVLCIHK